MSKNLNEEKGVFFEEIFDNSNEKPKNNSNKSLNDTNPHKEFPSNSNFFKIYNERDVVEKLFTTLFSKLPSSFYISSVDVDSLLINADLSKLSLLQKDQSLNDTVFDRKSIWRLSGEHVLVEFNNNNNYVHVFHNCTFGEEKKLIKYTTDLVTPYIIKETINEEKHYLNLIVTDSRGKLDTIETEIVPQVSDLSLNYNDDFLPTHETIIKRLNTPNDKGLVLLHGDPGTGKSSYIRYLISQIKGKELFYIPPDMASLISAPSFIPFLMEHQNSILIIEDGENILAKREGGQNQAVANLLNLSDGLLSDVLKMQIVCTFNTPVENIDSALLRKGRLIEKYEFKALEVEKSNKILRDLGKKTVVSGSTTLAEIYATDI